MGDTTARCSSFCFLDKLLQKKIGGGSYDQEDDVVNGNANGVPESVVNSGLRDGGVDHKAMPESVIDSGLRDGVVDHKAMGHVCDGALVVGHYCHDTLQLADGRDVEALGGSVSYMTNILDAFSLRTTVVSKVGADFRYQDQGGERLKVRARYLPAVVEGAKTVHFVADLRSGPDRVLTCRALCEPIRAADIPTDHRFKLALAAGVAGEILPETLEAMCVQATHAVADVQALVRSIDPTSGTVALLQLDQSPARNLLGRLSFIKASADEASAINLKVMRQRTRVILTRGSQGCTIYYRDMEFAVPTFKVKEVDPTGAGDSFLAGFAAGLSRNLPIEKAALLGNFCGSVAVSQVGVPKFDKDVRRVLNYYMTLPVDASFNCFQSFPTPEAAAASVFNDREIISSLMSS